MIDIVDVSTDLVMFDSQIAKAKNIMSVQLGSLEYEKEFGIDLRYFLQESIQFQNESFKGYLVSVLANRGINVASLEDTLEKVFATYNFNLAPEENSGAFLAR
jgi:hypothetical protein